MKSKQKKLARGLFCRVEKVVPFDWTIAHYNAALPPVLSPDGLRIRVVVGVNGATLINVDAGPSGESLNYYRYRTVKPMGLLTSNSGQAWIAKALVTEPAKSFTIVIDSITRDAVESVADQLAQSVADLIRN